MQKKTACAANHIRRLPQRVSGVHDVVHDQHPLARNHAIVAAAEVTVGLAIVVLLYRKKQTTSIEDLMTIADAGGIMPPKSTWFEPKLRDAMFCHMI